MLMEPNQAVVMIPSLEPDGKLVPYVRQLLEKGFCHVVVVDDGSGPAYQPVFAELAALPGCHVLHHEKNKGKGDALKTGFSFIREALKACPGVVTADSDGQHTVQDVWELASRLAQGENGLFLGTRDFSLPQVPSRSRAGNRITSFVFWLLYGRWLKDTQTGLRAFSAEHLDFMIRVEGHRFEYEMNMLISCARENLPIRAVPIETVYENQNKSTHFDTIKDSIRIYKVIFKNFFHFLSSSFLATGLDLGVNFLLYGLLEDAGLSAEGRTAIALGTARVISASVNFLVNKTFVFRFSAARREDANTLLRYFALCAFSWLVSWGTVTSLVKYLGFPYQPAVILVSTLLFFVNYRIQQRWVFKKHQRPAQQGAEME